MRILAGALLAALAACAQMYPFLYTEISRQPITLGPEWQEIHCPQPIETSLPEKDLYLLLAPGLKVPDFRDQEVVVEGRKVNVYAEVVDAENRVYPLDRWRTVSSFIHGRPRNGSYLRLTSPNLPPTLRVTKVRLRSSSPLRVEEVLWTSGRTPGGS